ncbi:MAG: ABC transporter ATP-binding protein [Chitinophagaceae bacterium]|nr:ABC transporter ATP-binding protein [Rubrivivax sp.]
MNCPFRRPLGPFFLSLCAGVSPTHASAADPVGGNGLIGQTWQRVSDGQAWQAEGHWRLALAPFAAHFRPSDEHQDVHALALERQCNDGWLAGASYFRNSFGQPSAYVYLGQRHTRLMGVPPLFFQWSAGLMYGYTGRYKDKVPLNIDGFSPGALVGLGWQLGRSSSAMLHLLGDAALMLQFSYDFR